MIEYFDNLKSKDKKHFIEKTPDGNCIAGWICMKRNNYMGSLLIETVNGETVNQFVQSMPKIHYFKDDKDMSLECDVYVGDKLDGSCLIIYPIFNSDGDLIEIIPKTRGRAVADKYFLDLYSKIDKKPIKEYYKNNDGVLIFELYGVLNQHNITYYNIGIDINLIAVYDEDDWLSPYKLWVICLKYHFEMVTESFRVFKNIFRGGKYKILLTNPKYQLYLNDKTKNHWEANSKEEIIQVLMDVCEELNQNYLEENNRLLLEGVVVSCNDEYGNHKFLKIKPKSILNGIRKENGVLKQDILKECQKYWDDYGSQIKEIYTEDENHPTEYIMGMLSEDYPVEMVNQSKNKIKRVFLQFWKNMEVPESIHNIALELKEEYGEQGIGYCMRMFAEKYPMMKKDARTVYSILETKGV